MSTTSSEKEIRFCKRCLEGMANVTLISNGDGTFTYEIDCNKLINEDLGPPTKTLGGEVGDLSACARSIICAEIGIWAKSQWDEIYSIPSSLLPPPPAGKRICLAFGVSKCWRFKTNKKTGQCELVGSEGDFSDEINSSDC